MKVYIYTHMYTCICLYMYIQLGAIMGQLGANLGQRVLERPWGHSHLTNCCGTSGTSKLWCVILFLPWSIIILFGSILITSSKATFHSIRQAVWQAKLLEQGFGDICITPAATEGIVFKGRNRSNSNFAQPEMEWLVPPDGDPIRKVRRWATEIIQTRLTASI